MTALQEAHRTATKLMQGALEVVQSTSLQVPTPCQGWSLGDLLAHQAGLELGFLLSFRGIDHDLSDWDSLYVQSRATRVASRLVQLTDDVVQGVDLASPAWLPTINADEPLNAETAIYAHVLDLVVHAWDLSASAGSPLTIGAGPALDCALIMARLIPHESRQQPDAQFAPSIAASGVSVK